MTVPGLASRIVVVESNNGFELIEKMGISHDDRKEAMIRKGEKKGAISFNVEKVKK